MPKNNQIFTDEKNILIAAQDNCHSKENDPVKNIILMFPGQGSQYIGMGLDFLECNKDYYKYIHDASRIFGEDLLSILKNENGKGNLIDKTEYSQILIYTISSVFNDYIFNNCKLPSIKLFAATGHSLGDYSALYSCGAFDFEIGAELVSYRGKLMASVSGSRQDNSIIMQDKVIRNESKEMQMAAIIGSDIETISDVLDNYKGSVFIANYNDYSQIVISGYLKDVLKASEEIKNRGAKKVLPLKVSVASHCPLMQPVSEVLGKFIDNDLPVFKKLNMDFFSSTEVLKINSNQIRNTLVNQLTHPVKWVDTIENLLLPEIDTFIEIGPGKTLSGLVKRIAIKMGREDLNILCTDTPSDMDNLKQYLSSL
ncbi:MAG: Polyketide biosynthesis protein BaeE [Actinobacteria bacterium ADurb.Bin346]|nr:MAG: Polyketide biosynthesis protein BaeE [Actinobacteria bacterium ADurb.Bin346]